MNPTLMVLIIISLIACAAGWWLSKRPWTKPQVFAAVMAWLASISILARGPAGVWFYIAAVIGATMGTALLLAGFRRWSTVGCR